tara:strand:+ start:570 stop:683 length:114 start_codon:yes stop_codon:yes gene_type:complete
MGAADIELTGGDRATLAEALSSIDIAGERGTGRESYG